MTLAAKAADTLNLELLTHTPDHHARPRAGTFRQSYPKISMLVCRETIETSAKFSLVAKIAHK